MQAAYCVLLNCKKNVCEEEVKINIILRSISIKKLKEAFFFFFWSCKLLVLGKNEMTFIDSVDYQYITSLRECSITRVNGLQTRTNKQGNQHCESQTALILSLKSRSFLECLICSHELVIWKEQPRVEIWNNVYVFF